MPRWLRIIFKWTLIQNAIKVRIELITLQFILHCWSYLVILFLDHFLGGFFNSVRATCQKSCFFFPCYIFSSQRFLRTKTFHSVFSDKFFVAVQSYTGAVPRIYQLMSYVAYNTLVYVLHCLYYSILCLPPIKIFDFIYQIAYNTLVYTLNCLEWKTYLLTITFIMTIKLFYVSPQLWHLDLVSRDCNI